VSAFSRHCHARMQSQHAIVVHFLQHPHLRLLST
jgi:hypothetical protein